MLYNFSGKYIYPNSDVSAKNYVLRDRLANELICGSLKVVLLIYVSLILGIGAPMYKLLFTDEKEMPMPVIYPFIDPDTKRGFYINLASQYLSCLSGFVIFPGVELVLCALKNNFTSYAVVVENDITDFGCQLKDERKCSHKRTSQFRNIILKVLDFGRFVSF